MTGLLIGLTYVLQAVGLVGLVAGFVAGLVAINRTGEWPL